MGIFAGADFIKTSTGKEGVNATIPVSLVMARAIRDYYERTQYKVSQENVFYTYTRVFLDKMRTVNFFNIMLTTNIHVLVEMFKVFCLPSHSSLVILPFFVLHIDILHPPC